MLACIRPHVRASDREWRRAAIPVVIATILAWPTIGFAQEGQPPPTNVHEHVAVTAPLLTPTKEASGTAWLPQVTPMYGVHRPWRGWDVRLAGVAFVQALYEPRDRHRTGGSSTRQAGSVNWGMVMARRSAGGGRFGIRTMVSAEPWTVSSCGSLSFLATGEVCDGDTIHDRQQQHDLIMELAVDYDRRLRGAWRWQVYAGLAGEPALGPPGYPHRASAIANPIGPVTHHWLDSTHVIFGVVTVGVHNQRWKVETSVFNGREPDESRVDLDLGAFDSVATRLHSCRANAWRCSCQRRACARRGVTSRFRNRIPPPAPRHLPFITCRLEPTVSGQRPWPSGRITPAQPCPAEYWMPPPRQRSSRAALHSQIDIRCSAGGKWEECPRTTCTRTSTSTSVFAIGKVQLGYVQQLSVMKGMRPGIGGTVSVSFLPVELAPRYSGRTAPSIGVFFSLQAARHQM